MISYRNLYINGRPYEEIIALKHLQLCETEKGSASSWSVIVLISLIVALGAAIYLLLPRDQAPKPEPNVVRMKIPSMPSPASTESAEEDQPSRPETATSPPLKQEAAALSEPDLQTGQTAASLDHDDPSVRPEPPSEQATVEPEDAPPAPADDATPPSTPVAAPDDAPVDPMAEEQPPADIALKEKTAAVIIAPTPPADSQEEEKPSDQIPISAETDFNEDRTNPAASPSAEEIDVPPADSAERPKPFTIQVGVFRNQRNADNLASDLKALGYSSFIHESQDKRQRPLYKVCFGRFETKDMAAQTIAAFKEEEKKPAVVVRVKSR